MAPIAPAFVSIVDMGTPSASRSRDTGLPNRSEFRARASPAWPGEVRGLFFRRRQAVLRPVVLAPAIILFVAVNSVLRVLGDPSRERQMDAVRFVLRRLSGTLGLYYLFGLTGLAMAPAYLGVKSIIGTTTAAGILAVFLKTQVYIAGRGWLRTAYQAGQLEMFTISGLTREAKQGNNGVKEEAAAV